MAAPLVCKLSNKQKNDLLANKPVLASVPQDTFTLDPRHQPNFMQYLWDRQELGLETFVLAALRTRGLMADVEIVP